jgi:hypothetical protein
MALEDRVDEERIALARLEDDIKQDYNQRIEVPCQRIRLF